MALRSFEQRLAQLEDARQAWNGTFPKWSLVAPGDTKNLDRELAAFAQAPDRASRVYQVASGAPPSRERILPPADVVVLKLLMQRR
jgi:hypothetical protein